MGWNAGVETWMKFQSRLQCSNALIQLLDFAFRQFKDQSNLNYGMNVLLLVFLTLLLLRMLKTFLVLHKANNFMSSGFSKAIYASVLIRNGRLDDAIKLAEESEVKFLFGINMWLILIKNTFSQKLILNT